MPVKFNIVERGNPGNPQAPKKFYPSIQSSGRVTTRQLAEQAAKESTVSPADIMAAIESFLSVIPTKLAKGNIVELGDFGTFWLRTTSEGAVTVEEVRSSQITSLLPRFNPGRLFKHVLDGVEYIRGVVTSQPEEEETPPS